MLSPALPTGFPVSVTRCSTGTSAPHWFECSLLGHAELLRFDDVEIIVDRFTVLDDPDGKLADTKNSVDGRKATLLDANGELFH